MAHRSFLLWFVCFVFLTTWVSGQGLSTKKETKPTKSKAAKSEEEDAVLAQRRVVAISLLTSLADEAHSFRDQTLRARVQARAADALWDTDNEKARTLFQRAWDDAEAADAETARRQAEDIRRQKQAAGVVTLSGSRDIRSEILRLVAKRDRALGEEFLKKLEEASARELADKKAEMDDSLRDLSAAPVAAAKRLQLARRLLEDGDISRALEFAAPALDQVNRETIGFLCALREKNASQANQVFAALLARTERDPAADANTVSGLSSYAFTPFMYVTFSRDGGSGVNQERPPQPRPEMPADLRAAFFRVAAQILLRPSPPPDQDLTTSGRTGKYMIIRRLMPLFDEFAPERAAELKTQMAALATDVPQDARDNDNRAVTRGIVPEDTSRDPLDKMQDRLDHARTTEDRDAIYADYAIALAGKGDVRARDLIDKIEDTETRRKVRAFTDFQFAQLAVRNKDANEAARIARTGELTGMQRIWVYTQASRLFQESDRTRAVEMLEAAAAEARRMSATDPDRAKGLVAAATGLMQMDRVRAWEIVGEAVKAANAAETFTGEDSNIVSRFQTKNMAMVSASSAEDFDLIGAFRSLAQDDFVRSIELAKTFTGESPRSVATLAIARSVLEKKTDTP